MNKIPTDEDLLYDVYCHVGAFLGRDEDCSEKSEQLIAIEIAAMLLWDRLDHYMNPHPKNLELVENQI